MASTNELNLVIGASGGLGKAVVRELAAQGKRVRAANRSGRAKAPPGVELAACDAANPGQVREVCRGASVVYHCVNVPYPQWFALLPGITAAIIEGAAAAAAKLVVGDNLYMYGPASVPLREDLPNNAVSRKGRLRAQLAERLLEAHRQGKVPVAIARGADFYGPGVLNAVAGERLFGAALKNKTVNLIGDLDQPHTYTFIDDFAKGMLTLAERAEALGEVWHLPNAETLTTRQFAELVFQQTGTRPAVRSAGPGLVALLGLFNPILRELKEELYQFQQPFIVDHGKYARVFGTQITPHEEAIRQTLEWFRGRGAQ